MDATIIILGATGDLSRRKLIPAVYNLVKNKKIDNFALVGVSITRLQIDSLLHNSKSYINDYDAKTWKRFVNRSYYYQANFYEKEKFCGLGDFVRRIEKKHNLSGNRLLYLATVPDHFKVITENLAECKLTKGARVALEKPFGKDLKTAKSINRCIRKHFKEDQIFRVDHYLGKELIQNLSVMRFTNTVLEPLWNRKYVDHVQIIMSENFGVKGRGQFYDQYGALKDVVQNHILQMMALTAMEAPKKLGGEYIRDEKVKVLNSVRTTNRIVFGQFHGYKDEKGVANNSKTETFASLKLFVDNKRWKNTPFYLIAGKNMKKRRAAIHVQFKGAPCLLFKNMCSFSPNHLTIEIQPDQGFHLHINSKVPGKEDISTVKMEFCQECVFGPNSPEAYENILDDVLAGDKSVFIRNDEIEAQWKITDAIVRRKVKIDKYKKGTMPKQADKMIQKDRREWKLECD